MTRADLISALNEAADASSSAREVMTGVERALRTGALQLTQGRDIQETLCTSRIEELRTELQAAMDRVARTRHEFRMALASQCADSGMSTREIGELWGFSRQRAQALIQETREARRAAQG